jgi:DNA repair protein SbcD/Mre11
MIRFLHLADVHLDTTFAGRAEHRAYLQEACRRSFGRAIDAAIERDVHAVLIAGDLFDGERLTLETELFLIDQLQRLHEHGIPCVYAAGNHDPGGSEYRAQHMEWPASFSFIKGKRVETVVISDRSGVPIMKVSGAGHLTSRVKENLAEAFPRRDDALPHVGLLHTMVHAAAGSEDHDRYAPSTLADLAATGYSYWALGHIHIRQQVSADARAWYSGNVMGRNPRETGPKGANLVTVHDDGRVEIEFMPLAVVRWESIIVDDLEACNTPQALLGRLHTAITTAQADAEDVEAWFVRVTLSGACPLASRLRDIDGRTSIETNLARDLGLRWIEIRTRDLSTPIDLDEYRGQPHVLASALSLIDELEHAATLEEPSLLKSWAIEPSDAYVRSLLPGLSELVAERFLSGKEEG